MLTDVANKFVTGQNGEAEIWVAFCTELLRNFDPKAILKRAADLRTRFDAIQHEFFTAISEIKQFKSWEAHRDLGYEDWREFSEKVLGLSSQIAEALLSAREQVTTINPNQFLQAMIKGYAVPAISNMDQPIVLEKIFHPKSDSQTIIKELKTRLERAEFKIGELIRNNKACEEELVQTRAEKYREVQKRDAVIDKLCRNMDSPAVKPFDEQAPKTKNVRNKMIRKTARPQTVQDPARSNHEQDRGSRR